VLIHAAAGGVAHLGSRSPSEVTLLSARLVDALNVQLADAMVAPTLTQPGGGGTIPGLARGLSLTAADRAQYTLDWSAERPVSGAALSPGQE